MAVDLTKYLASKLDKFRNDVTKNPLIASPIGFGQYVTSNLAHDAFNGISNFHIGNNPTVGQTFQNTISDPNKWNVAHALSTGFLTTGNKTADSYIARPVGQAAGHAMGGITFGLLNSHLPQPTTGMEKLGAGIGDIAGFIGGLETGGRFLNPIGDLGGGVTTKLAGGRLGTGILSRIAPAVGSELATSGALTAANAAVGNKIDPVGQFAMGLGLRGTGAGVGKLYGKLRGPVSNVLTAAHPDDAKALDLASEVLRNAKSTYGERIQATKDINNLLEGYIRQRTPAKEYAALMSGNIEKKIAVLQKYLRNADVPDIPYMGRPGEPVQVPKPPTEPGPLMNPDPFNIPKMGIAGNSDVPPAGLSDMGAQLDSQVRQKVDNVLRLQGNSLKDVSVIGSTARGKANPRDLDILVTPTKSYPELTSDKLNDRMAIMKVFENELQPLFPNKKLHVTIADYKPDRGAKISLQDYYNTRVAQQPGLSDTVQEASKFTNAKDFYQRMSSSVRDQLRSQGIKGEEAITEFWNKNAVKSEPILDSLNPTGSVLVKYDPQSRMTMKLGPNMTTYDRTAGLNPDELVTVYRGTSGGKINPGDFITTNYDLAKSYNGKGKVVSMKVKASDILDDATSPLGDEYIYRPQSRVGQPSLGNVKGPIMQFAETPKIEKALGDALAGAQSAEDEAKIVSEFTNLAIKNAKGNSLRATRAAMVREMKGIAGVTGNYKSDFAMLQTMKDDPMVGPRINALEDAISKIDTVLKSQKPNTEAQLQQIARLSKTYDEFASTAKENGLTPDIKVFNEAKNISSEGVVKKGKLSSYDIPTQTEIKNRAEVNAGNPDLYTQRQAKLKQAGIPTDGNPEPLPWEAKNLQTQKPETSTPLGQLEEARLKSSSGPRSDVLQPTQGREVPQRQQSQAQSFEDIVRSEPINVKQKVTLLDYLRTPDRVLQKIGLGGEAVTLRRSYDKYLKELPQEIGKITEWSKRVTPEGNVKIFKYLDGQSVTLNPTEMQVATEVKSYLKDWADKLGLPEDKRITNYITHIFDRELVQKEFDPELAKLIQDKVAGSVYDPFTEQRLGKLGYVEDTWRALDAYVKRATRKYNLDPVLKDIQGKSDVLEQSQFNYVKRYIDRVNMRPTELENLMDNTIKGIIGYKFGARPFTVISKGLRQAIFRGTLGLNVGSALRNLTQGVNTYATLGEKYTAIGYTNLAKSILTKSDELERVGVLRDDFVQDRTISATKKFWEKTDKGLFALFEAAEKINRGSAYFGAKAQAISKGMSEEQAVEYAKDIVRKTQFTFGSVDTPIALQSDVAKTLGQFQSYNLKQAEFLAEMVKNKNFAALTRFTLGSLAVFFTVGKVLGMKPQDLLPSFKVAGSPLFTGAQQIGDAAMGTKDKYGNTPSPEDRLKKAGGALLPFFPAGVQLKKSIEGYGAASQGYSTSKSGRVQYAIPQDPLTIARSTLFGKNNLPQSQAYYNQNGQTLSSKQSDQVKQAGGNTVNIYNSILQGRANRRDEKAIRSQVDNTGQSQTVNGIHYYKDSYDGKVYSIDLNKSIPQPKLTGNTELDKKLVSSYQGKITSRESDIKKLYEQGVYTADQAEQQLKDLEKLRSTYGRGRKIRVAKVKLSKARIPKVKIAKPKKVKVKKLTVSSVKTPKVGKLA